MALSNSNNRYGNVAKLFHWATALMIVTLIPLGIMANGAPYETSDQLTQKALLFSIHKTLGVAVFFVALARILWAINQPKPANLHPDRKLESGLAELVHWLLYGSLVLVPLTGWIAHAATTGFAPIWWPFGQSLPFVPKDGGVSHTFSSLHIIFERVLAASIILHVAGALKHHFIDKDVTLKRMWFGDTQSNMQTSAKHSKTPFFAAIGVWAAALAIGAGLGLFQHTDTVRATTTLESAPSDWVIQDGTLAIAITQFGAQVDGQFDNWTASIDHDATITSGPTGSVTVDIDVNSLTLGSVTDQALDPDYFDATGFPTAQFTADLSVSDGQHMANGTLTIKGVSAPLTFPFDLEITDGTATMTATAQLDRRNFGIGDSLQDEGSLAFAVAVNISLTATLAQ